MDEFPHICALFYSSPPKDDSGRVTIRMKGKSLKLRGDFDAVANILKSVLPFYSGPPSKVKGLFEGFIGTLKKKHKQKDCLGSHQVDMTDIIFVVNKSQFNVTIKIHIQVEYCQFVYLFIFLCIY